ncbi:MAG: diguanylate cyclase [Gammaproteobacteria bacterium]|nr:diguanylate cyclase [Gammaproteobacteria bacterium]
MGKPLLERKAGNDDDWAKRVRLRRFLMSFASYGMWYAIALAALELGFLRASTLMVALAGVGILVCQAIFYFLMRSGISLRFRDPSLTMPQILVGLAWSLVLVASAVEIRGLTIAAFMVTMLFGIFALDSRQFMICAFMAFASYVGLVIVEQSAFPGLLSEDYYTMSVLVLGGVLLWTMLFGVYVSNLRFKLQQRNEELMLVNQRIRELAEHDDLTGIYNRRYIMQLLNLMKARSDRTGEPFSVVLIDLDHFKKVNDRYGHAAGDQALADFAELTEDTLRGMDLIAQDKDEAFGRYGGEEFIILLPATRLEGAMQCAERLRLRQEEVQRAEQDAGMHVTLSAGIAEYRHGEAVEDMLKRADKALYSAKDRGRNQVVQETA